MAEERARAEKAQRARRLRMLGGLVVAAIVVVVVVIAVTSGGGGTSAAKPNSPSAQKAATTVATLLQGIPQQGTTLGNPNAPVTVTEYGDLVCPICRDFALSSEQQLISKDVRSGKAKLVYKALETASAEANGSMFVPSQVAARAAGEQKLGWNYIQLFYHEQGDETQSYVTNNFLDGLAKQISGLNFSKWSSDLQSSALQSQVSADQRDAAAAGYNSTPTIVIKGPKGQAQPIVGNPTGYSQLEQAIKSVS